jgi:hypothetical protein
MNTLNNSITCEICGVVCKNSNSYNGHYTAHHSDFPPANYIKCCCIYTRRETTVVALSRIQANIRHCKHCDNVIIGKNVGKKQFCNSSCAAQFNNASRIANGYIITDAHKQKTSTSHKRSTVARLKHDSLISNINYVEFVNKPGYLIKLWMHELPQFETIHNSSGAFTLILHNTCKHCGALFNHRRRQKYCNVCSPLYIDGRNKYLFTFNVFNYPQLFNLDEITRIGFYQRNQKDKATNVNRLTRDHRVTINTAIRHNYDSYYITHPLNCAILPWIENNRKNTTSSITYEQLVEMVDAYDNNTIA